MARRTTFGPLLGLKVLAVAAVAAAVLLGAAEPPRGAEPAQSSDALLRRTARAWCERYGRDPRFQVASVEVLFRATPQHFAEAEGVVVAPVALHLPGLQKVLEVDAYPPALRKLPAEGILSLAWEYPGRSNRELRYLSLALVERPPRAAVAPPAAPSFAGLDPNVREDALVRAVDLEEHQLHRCAAFPEWARRTAGDPPYTEQLLRLVRTVAAQARPDAADSGETDDACAGMRTGRFARHLAQVLAVMGAREVGVPAFAFGSASPGGAYLVGTYTDQAGWLLLDLEDARKGYFAGGDALLTRMPVLGTFAASQESFWDPAGAAYGQGEWGGGISGFSRTVWAGRAAPEAAPADTTTARTVPLAEVCP